MAVDQFFILTPDYEVACGDTGYYLKMSHGRDGDTLYLRHETLAIGRDHDPKSAILCFCSRSARPMTLWERLFSPADMCPRVILWAVAWPKVRDAEEIDGLGNTRIFLHRFFRWYQSVGGVGCYLDGNPRRALVDVKFGAVWYGIDH